MNLRTMMHRVLSISRAQIVLGGSFIIFVIVAIVIFIGYKPNNSSYVADDTKLHLASEATTPLDYRYNDISESLDSGMDDAIGIADFDRRLDVVGERLSSMELYMSQLQDELYDYRNIRIETSQSLSSELQALKNRMTELMKVDSFLNGELKDVKATLHSIEAKQPSKSPSELPVAGLKLLSVSIWDDGAVAIVTLGNRKTGLSVGNFFAGLKVEDISVTEQSLTLYEPVANKLYTLYADSILYKEAVAQ